MTKKFEEIVNRLTKSRNFDNGAYVLITVTDGCHKQVDVKYNHKIGVVSGICEVIDIILQKTEKDRDGQIIRDCIKKVLIKDEERRFQASSEEPKSE